MNVVSNPGRARAPAAQGEALATWALWAVLLAVLAVTYTRLDPDELYNVSRQGVTGGLSRVLVELNFPVSLVAIALVLIALDGLPRRWWALGVPAIALCAVTAVPGVVDEGDLDARPINVVPAVGVALALVLTMAAVSRTGAGFGARRRGDPLRVGIAVVVLVMSLPWIVGDLGFYIPEGVFIAERPIARADGTVSPAVHLGHHHGFDGALLTVSALLLSRPRLRSPGLATATRLYVALMLAYGLFNFGQDYWNEQIQKRGWIDWSIDSALEPSLSPGWLVIIVLAGAVAVVLRQEASDHEFDGRTAERVHGASSSH